jgi:hypothetical protein
VNISPLNLREESAIRASGVGPDERPTWTRWTLAPPCAGLGCAGLGCAALAALAAVGLVGQHKFDVFPFGGLRIDPADVVDRCADIVFAQVISQLAGAGKIGGIAGAQRELGQPSIPGGTEHLGRRIVRLPGRLRPNADID